jgi:hypothetical protein
VQVNSYGTNPLTFDDATIALQAPGHAAATAFSNLKLNKTKTEITVQSSATLFSKFQMEPTKLSLLSDPAVDTHSEIVLETGSINAKAWNSQVNQANPSKLVIENDDVTLTGPTATGASIAVKNQLIVLKGSANSGINVTNTQVLIKGLTAVFKAEDNSITINSGGINLN